jgi:putative ABC transport system permease protein
MNARFWAEVYRTALLLLPASARRDRGEMAAALEDQLRSAATRMSASRAVLRALWRLPGVLAVEWLDVARGANRSHGIFAQNVRFAARTLRNSPTFTWVSVLLIGLGVGAVTTVFTVVDHVLLRPLPYPDQERLAYLTNGSHNGPTLRGLGDIAAFDLWTAARAEQANLVRADSEPLRIQSVEVSTPFFAMFGARPALGRVLVAEDATDRSVAVLTHAAWTSVFGADPRVVGSTIRLDGEPVAVVGVLEEGFVNPEILVGRDAQLFRPMDWDDPMLQERGFHAHRVAARLAQGVDLAGAQAAIDRLFADLRERELLTTTRNEPWPLVPLQEVTVRGAREGLVLLLASVGLLLLVACANVALLFMARGISRVREMSVRRALGARTGTLLGQLVAESLLVGLAGATIGIVLARGGLAGFERWIGGLPRADAIVLDLRVLLFTTALSLATALVFGLAPALRSLGQDVNAELRASGRSSTEGRGVRWVRSGLIVGEVGVSVVLVAVAGLLLRSFLTVTSQDAGIDPDGVWVIPLNLSGNETPEQARRRMDAMLAAIETVPGVSSATYGIEMPFENVGGSTCCWSGRTSPDEIVDQRRDGVLTFYHAVTSDFFETLGTGLVSGSGWSAGDPVSEPFPAVLTESLAIQHFGSARSAVGRELRRGRDGLVRVVGVAEPTLHYGLDQELHDGMYLPVQALSSSVFSFTFAVRLSGDGGSPVAALRRAIWSADPDQPVPSVEPLEAWIDASTGVRRLSSALSSAFGVVALILAAGGLYGTLLYAASQRRRELGIRIALGAGRRQIQSDVVAGGVGLAVLGLLFGIPAAIYLGRLLEDFLWNVAPTDVSTLVTAATVLLAAAALASWLPAYRASRTDPLEVLRAD